MKTLFLGDLEAQYKICRQELEHRLVPTVDRIVSLGNLTSCSAAAKDRQDLGRNELVLTFWDKLEASKVRLIGPNEIMALNFPSEWTNNKSNTFLRDGWLTETPSILTATEDKGRLVTHGGLTYGEWLAIGAPETAREAAEALNDKYRHTLAQGDCFKLTQVPAMDANPIWADPVLELYPSWIMAPEPCPFDQVHGGESLNSERGREAAAHAAHPLAYLDSLSYRKFGSLAMVKGAVFRAIDLGLPGKLLTTVPADKAFYVEAT